MQRQGADTTMSTSRLQERGFARSGLPAQAMSLALALLGSVGAAGCESDVMGDDREGFSAEEWKAIKQIEPLAGPQHVNASNRLADDLDAARLGQMIFFDPDFSGPIKVDSMSGKVGETGKVACVTCHDPKRSFIDSRTTDGVSYGVALTARSSPPLINLGWYDWYTWAGRMDSLSMQAANAPEAVTDVATTRLFFAHVLWRKYRDEYNAIFPETPLDPALDPTAPDASRFPPKGKPKAAATDPDGDWEKMAGPDKKIINQIMANVGKAIEAYERQLVSRGSAFERWVKGDDAAMTDEAKRGLRLFVGKAACNECHNGPVMSDSKFHNIGVPQAVGLAPAVDTGRFVDVPKLLANPFNGGGAFSDDPDTGAKKLSVVTPNDPSTIGQFRTPTLHNIADTAPYYHNGSIKTLDDVVWLYNNGGGAAGSFSGTKDVRVVPLGLTAQEQTDLVAFLKSLTGGPVPEEWAANTAKH